MSQIYSYRSDQQEANQGTLTKQGLDGPAYLVDFTDGVLPGVTLGACITTAVDAANATVTSNCIFSTGSAGTLVMVKMLTCGGSSGTAPATDGAQFRLRTTAALSSGGPLIYDVFVIIENPVYNPA